VVTNGNKILMSRRIEEQSTPHENPNLSSYTLFSIYFLYTTHSRIIKLNSWLTVSPGDWKMMIRNFGNKINFTFWLTLNPRFSTKCPEITFKPAGVKLYQSVFFFFFQPLIFQTVRTSVQKRKIFQGKCNEPVGWRRISRNNWTSI